MAEKATISTAFYMQLATILTIVVSSIVGFNFGVNKMEEIADTKLLPLISRIESLEKSQRELTDIVTANSERIQVNYICINSFLEYYNTTFHKEFLRPGNVSLQNEKRRR